MSRADSTGHETLVQCLSSFYTLGGTRSSDILQDVDFFSWGLKFTTSKNVNDAFLGYSSHPHSMQGRTVFLCPPQKDPPYPPTDGYTWPQRVRKDSAKDERARGPKKLRHPVDISAMKSLGPWLFRVCRGWETTQLNGDYNKPVKGPLLTKQYNGK